MMTRCFSPPLTAVIRRSASISVSVSSIACPTACVILDAVELPALLVGIASHPDHFFAGKREAHFRVLHHHRHVPRPLLVFEPSERESQDLNFSRLDWQDAAQGQEQRRFPGPIGSQNANEFTFFDGKGNPFQDRVAGIAAPQVLHPNQSCRYFLRWSRR